MGFSGKQKGPSCADGPGEWNAESVLHHQTHATTASTRRAMAMVRMMMVHD
jgi:hypothetical protein